MKWSVHITLDTDEIEERVLRRLKDAVSSLHEEGEKMWFSISFEQKMEGKE